MNSLNIHKSLKQKNIVQLNGISDVGEIKQKPWADTNWKDGYIG